VGETGPKVVPETEKANMRDTGIGAGGVREKSRESGSKSVRPKPKIRLEGSGCAGTKSDLRDRTEGGEPRGNVFPDLHIKVVTIT
jgi:hypothetical protein